jgi:choline dehydrogenase
MTALACDYLVIGAGSAGCVVANRLSENPANRVILLEAGGRDSDLLLRVPGAISRNSYAPQFNWNYWCEPQPALNGRRIFCARGKVLGGSSSINGMIYIRGHARDYDYWRQDGCVGWSYEDVLPFFRKAECNERGADEFHGGDGPLVVSKGRPVPAISEAFLHAAKAAGYPTHVDFNGAQQEGFGHYDTTTSHGERWSTASAYLKPIRGRANLTVLTRAEVTRLIFDGRRVRGAEVVQDGKPVRIEAARETVLSAGVFNSPKILLLSGIGPAEELRSKGIEVRLDRAGVGRNLQDHISYWMKYGCSKPVTAYAYTRPVRGALAVLNYLFFRRGIISNGPFCSGGFFRSHDGLEIPDMQIGLSIGLVPAPGKLPDREGFTVTVRQGRPGSRGTVRLASADPAAAPLIDPNYFSDPDDMVVLMRGIRRIRDVMRHDPIAGLIGSEIPAGIDYTDDAALEASIRDVASTTHHFIGTCRMGADDAAIVDPQLRVRGLAGLRVIDASIMPTHINGNTNAAAIMIGEKGAAMMAEART